MLVVNRLAFAMMLVRLILRYHHQTNAGCSYTSLGSKFAVGRVPDCVFHYFAPGIGGQRPPLADGAVFESAVGPLSQGK